MKTFACAVVAAVILGAGASLVEAADQIDAAMKFLLGWGKGNWEDVAASAAEKVTVSVGGKESTLDVAGKKADATLVFPFKGLSTVREAGKVKAVTVDEIAVKAGGEVKKGKGTLSMEEKDGKFRVTKVAVE